MANFGLVVLFQTGQQYLDIPRNIRKMIVLMAYYRVGARAWGRLVPKGHLVRVTLGRIERGR